MLFKSLARCVKQSITLEQLARRTCSVGFKHSNPLIINTRPRLLPANLVRSLSLSGQRFNDKRNDDDNDDGQAVFLMDFVPRGMPNLFFSIKNFFIINFIIRGYIDKTFDFKTFLSGAKQAFFTISSYLANNQLDELAGLVDDKALEEIKTNLHKLSLDRRQKLEMREGDIILSFAHHIDIETLKEDFTGTRKHIVRIFLVFDCIRGLEQILKEKAQARAHAREIFKEFSERKYICNYEFTREYIEGGSSTDWIVTKLLHVSEADLRNL